MALGGGGARGFAHLGVLRVLEREKIPIDRIVGTSMGAIVGAMYAQSGSIENVISNFQQYLEQNRSDPPARKEKKNKKSESQRWFDTLATRFRDQVLLGKGSKKTHLDPEDMIFALEILLREQPIEETRIPFAAVATDVLTGDEVILSSGPITSAVAASSALPGVLPPVEYEGKLLIDGAATSSVPVRAAKKLIKHKKIIASDVSAELSEKPRLDNAVDIVMRNSRITSKYYRDELVKEADVLIQPQVGNFHWSHFDHLQEFIRQGEKAAEIKLSEIRRAARWF
ncbi:MAG: patatin-like phospholipase family protein [candidate division KSB1 bacterium]|nr:patatin-like phospholipase family protein [candidate division KSB1 bacterium]